MNWKNLVLDMEALGWSVTGLAREVGISQQGLSDIKHGRTSAPNGMVAVRLHALWQAKTPPAAKPSATKEAA
ncbi:hypothetical protein CO615_04635 [Lysobacteraceae bacterium NML75-0749]|nr:hypothetical protein CO615_04635 [Xanthomonadaceae bacterium NML75-0749]